jgi:hypothetical protein
MQQNAALTWLDGINSSQGLLVELLQHAWLGVPWIAMPCQKRRHFIPVSSAINLMKDVNSRPSTCDVAARSIIMAQEHIASRTDPKLWLRCRAPCHVLQIVRYQQQTNNQCLLYTAALLYHALQPQMCQEQNAHHHHHLKLYAAESYAAIHARFHATEPIHPIYLFTYLPK